MTASTDLVAARAACVQLEQAIAVNTDGLRWLDGRLREAEHTAVLMQEAARAELNAMPENPVPSDRKKVADFGEFMLGLLDLQAIVNETRLQVASEQQSLGLRLKDAQARVTAIAGSQKEATS
jgi:uncharacterized protein (DUF2236 family)